MREPGNLKKRRIVGATKRKAPDNGISVPEGTTSGHCMQVIHDTMDIMDGFFFFFFFWNAREIRQNTRNTRQR
jgi:hypothetical protein